jgi:hypothetical protein
VLNKLSGWKRVGLVLSVLWALGSFLYVRNIQITRADQLYEWAWRGCINGDYSKFSACLDEFSYQRALTTTAYWPDVAFYALAPIVAAWLACWIGIRTYRWVREGFRSL